MILCYGEALIDMVPLTLEEEKGKREKSFLPCPGGSPYNTAIAVGRLGVPVGFLGRLSEDFFGDMLIERLHTNTVHTDLIRRSGEPSTLGFVQLEPGKEPQYLFYIEGTAASSFSLRDLPETLPPEVGCLLFGSIAMTMEPAATAIETLIFREAARGQNAPVISLDPNIRPFMIRDRDVYRKRFESWVKAATIVKVSSADLGFIYPELSPDEGLQRLLSLGPRLAVMTLGADGALGVLRQDTGAFLRVRAPVVDLPVADTIGAGDTFHGALLAWLDRTGALSRSQFGALTEKALHEALVFANKAASLVCTRHGTEPPTLAEVQSLP